MGMLPSGVSHNRYPALDGYRAIAAFLIVGTHVAFLTGESVRGPIGSVFARFDFGVALFFLLSGFLLYSPFASHAISGRTTPSNKTFYWRRFMRVMPAYWLFAIVVLATAPGLTATPRQWIANLSLTQIYVPNAQVSSMGQIWSLATEVSFYAILPVIAWATTRRRRGEPRASYRRQFRVLTVIGLTGVLFQVLICFGPLGSIPLIGLWLPAYLDWFALGMLAALVRCAHEAGVAGGAINGWKLATKDVNTCLIVGVTFFVIALTPISGTYVLDPDPGFNRFVKHVLYGLSALFILIPGFYGAIEGRWLHGLSSPFAKYMGTISYGVFLWHLYVADWIMHLLNMEIFKGGFLVLLPLTFIGSALAGWLSWIIVEKHVIAISHRGVRRRKPPVSPDHPIGVSA